MMKKMTKEGLTNKFHDALPGMAKDSLWCIEATNSLGFIRTSTGIYELQVTLVSDQDKWIIDNDPIDENTYDLEY